MSLFLVILLGGLLRLWGLGKNPPGLYWDEVSLGWNAYSILKTGRDEHGRFLPLDTFYAFGDYKPPLYIYATVPAIVLFGLNEFAVRLPSAVVGVALILVTYFLVKILIRSDLAARSDLSRRMPCLAALLVAISPWSIMLSRVAFEANLGVLFNAMGVLFFLYAVRRNFKWLSAAVISFTLAAYTFNANRVISPLLLVGLSLVYFRKMLANWKIWGISGVMGILLVLPMIPHLKSAEGKLRWREVNIFSDLKVIEDSNKWREEENYSWVSRLFYHRYLGYGKLFLDHYWDHFNLNYLFLNGDPNPRISVPGRGEMYLAELPLFLAGIIFLLTKKSRIQTALLLGGWWLLAVIPAGMARETPHALRTASVLPIPQIVTAIGIVKVQESTRKYKKVQEGLLIFITCLLFVSLIQWQRNYWGDYQNRWAGEWLAAYKPLVEYTERNKESYNRIYVTPHLGRPYVYFLFYGRHDPLEYIEEARSGMRTGDAFGFFDVKGFGKYRFYIPDEKDVSGKDMMILKFGMVPQGFYLMETINGADGIPEFNVVGR